MASRSRSLGSCWYLLVTFVAAPAACCRPSRAATATATDGPMTSPRPERVVLVTGSTDGLGREVARRLADSGMHVIVHGRSEERGEALVREIAHAGQGSARFHRADLASLAEVRASRG